MRRLIAVTVGVLLSAALIPVAGAEGPPAQAKQEGIKNAKKAVQGKQNQGKKVSDRKKKAEALRQQSQEVH